MAGVFLAPHALYGTFAKSNLEQPCKLQGIGKNENYSQQGLGVSG